MNLRQYGSWQLRMPIGVLMMKTFDFDTKNTFPLGPDPLGIVAAGTPHAVVSLDSHHRPTKSPFPTGFCRRFQRGEQYSSCNFNHQGFTFSQPMPLSQATGKFRQNCVVTEIHSSHPKQLSPFLLHCLIHTM